MRNVFACWRQCFPDSLQFTYEITIKKGTTNMSATSENTTPLAWSGAGFTLACDQNWLDRQAHAHTDNLAHWFFRGPETEDKKISREVIIESIKASVAEALSPPELEVLAGMIAKRMHGQLFPAGQPGRSWCRIVDVDGFLRPVAEDVCAVCDQTCVDDENAVLIDPNGFCRECSSAIHAKVGSPVPELIRDLGVHFHAETSPAKPMSISIQRFPSTPHDRKALLVASFSYATAVVGVVHAVVMIAADRAQPETLLAGLTTFLAWLYLLIPAVFLAIGATVLLFNGCKTWPRIVHTITAAFVLCGWWGLSGDPFWWPRLAATALCLTSVTVSLTVQHSSLRTGFNRTGRATGAADDD